MLKHPNLRFRRCVSIFASMNVGGQKNFRLTPRATLEYLDKEQTKKLCEWLLGRFSYRENRRKLKEELGVDTHLAAISKFYKRNVLQHVLRMREQAVYMAAGYSEEALKSPGRFTSATMDALEAKAMTACFDPSTSPKDLKVYLELLLRWQEQKIREEANQLKLRRLEMLERRQAKLEETITNSRLSSEEVAERCRLIFKHNRTAI